jgi:methyl-accepting chemotaxis protein
MYGDPDELDRLAARLRQRATEVREQAAEHVRRGQRAHWVSASAERYRERLTRDLAQADRVADEIDRAAAALTAHAREVRETLARIAQAERDTVHWFEHAARTFAERVERLADHLRHALQPPWHGWQYQPGRLPAPGDRQWLDVGRYMRAKGAF